MRLEMLGPDEACGEATKQAVAIARGVAAGTVELISGARELTRLGSYIVSDIRTDKDFVVFLGFDSETLHLPVGVDRQHWAPTALQDLDRELAEFERRWGPRVRSACNSLISRFGAA
jgi:hypothetical protein